MIPKDDIIALATPTGVGAIGVVRISGNNAINIVASFFKSKHGKDLKKQKSHTVMLGHILDGNKVLDEVLLTIFKGPNSYTGENVVEISCHGSTYIQQQIIQLFLRNGCRIANPGEFTLRAFLNGKMDLSQAEAVADLISSDNEASHQVAMQQMRGGFSNEIKLLRDELMSFASLIELELDFAEEDVEFANRKQLEELLDRIKKTLKGLIDSFAVGNVIKNGIPVAIVGEPNVGKSTLLNALLNEERAIVSEIAGTTRDSIEDEITIGGLGFRFIDTAGIRKTDDTIEGMGIKRTYEKIAKAQVVLYLINGDEIQNSSLALKALRTEVKKLETEYPDKPILAVVNKTDLITTQTKKNIETILNEDDGIKIQMLAAKTGEGLEKLKIKLLEFVNAGLLKNNDTIITNSRHYDSLLKALEEIDNIKSGMIDGVSGDLLAIDVRKALFHMGEITGEVTSDDVLGNIFKNFCIGK